MTNPKKGNFKLKIERVNAGPLVNCYLAGGATWDGSWWTNQTRHPEEIVKQWKHRTNAEKRAEELRANGIVCEVEVL